MSAGYRMMSDQALRFVIVIVSLALIMAINWAIGGVIGLDAGAVAAGKSPFGLGLSEGGQSSGGLAGLFIEIQTRFSQSMSAAVLIIKSDPMAIITVGGLGFAYGVFHAAGPGHGKAIISTYAFSNDVSLRRATGMALAAAVVQGVVAIALVVGLSIILRATASTVRDTASVIEILSFAGIALIGLALLWQKSGKLQQTLRLRTGDYHDHHHHHDHQDHHHDHRHHGHDTACDHVHAPLVQGNASWRIIIGTVLAAGIRPCSGSILVLVLALSQGLFGAGLLAVAAISLGTGLTTSAIAAFSLVMRSAARHFATKLTASSYWVNVVIAGLETLASAFILALGLTLIVAAI